MANGVNVRLGSYLYEEAAALAFNKKAIELHGEFAVLNKLTDKEKEIAASHPAKRINSSKYPGVSWSKKGNAWQASSKIEGKRKFLGYFKTEDAAYLAIQQTTKTVVQKEAEKQDVMN